MPEACLQHDRCAAARAAPRFRALEIAANVPSNLSTPRPHYDPCFSNQMITSPISTPNLSI